MPSKSVSENISNEKIQLCPIGPAAPDILPVPETTIWQIYTTYVVNTVEIWVRLGDENVSVQSYHSFIHSPFFLLFLKLALSRMNLLI